MLIMITFGGLYPHPDLCGVYVPSLHKYPHNQPGNHVDVLHGVRVPDPYRWLEAGGTREVRAWEEAQDRVTRDVLDKIPQTAWLQTQLDRLWRYDDQTPPKPCLLSTRFFYTRRKAEQDKWVVYMKDHPEAEERVVLDPNTWDPTDTLDWFSPSPDGQFVVYGRGRAGNEDAVAWILDLSTGSHLEDTLQGRRISGVVWRHDNRGFYFSGNPRRGEVPEGEHFYWHRIWFHQLGTSAAADVLVWHHATTKEYFHFSDLSDCGRYLLLMRVHFDLRQIFVQDLVAGGEPQPLMPEMDARYEVEAVGPWLYINTDWGAARGRILRAPLTSPGRENWQEVIPESSDAIVDMGLLGGHLYVEYLAQASTRIKIFTPSGTPLGEIPLPALGNGSVWGTWRRPEVWVSFDSFGHIPATYQWDIAARQLKLYHQLPIGMDVSDVTVRQVWYPSRDGTPISMFVVEKAGQTGPRPFLLTGYGGFNVHTGARFSTVDALWIQQGGGMAVPNLRGGGEYGKVWHEAGMREKKQNVFDDFIGAAEWLIQEGLTSTSQLAIMGGSNGGLLVGAAITQRPELFQAMWCQVPLIDMVRFHHFGLANIWSLEYGNSEDEHLFPSILAYSPYHHVKPGVVYPASLITGSENDARTDPLHARKFAASLQDANPEGEDILLAIQRDSGHGGAVTIRSRAGQWGDGIGFLMGQVGLLSPEQM